MVPLGVVFLAEYGAQGVAGRDHGFGSVDEAKVDDEAIDAGLAVASCALSYSLGVAPEDSSHPEVGGIFDGGFGVRDAPLGQEA